MPALSSHHVEQVAQAPKSLFERLLDKISTVCFGRFETLHNMIVLPARSLTGWRDLTSKDKGKWDEFLGAHGFKAECSSRELEEYSI